MKIISWNVNGIRACIAKGFLEFLKSEDPDIICLQETKAHQEQVDAKLEQYPHHFWNSAQKKGYSGTAVFSKIKPINITTGIGVLDSEGRIQTLEFENFYLVNNYTPNSKPDLSRLPLRYNEWHNALMNHIKNLEKKKPVIICGDLNVAHTEQDIARPASNKTTATKPGSPGFTNQEREKFTDYLNNNLIDTFRELNPEKIKYSWWSYMGGARTRNVGWRIDYFLASKSLKPKIKTADILDQVMGSDHAPVLLEIN
jgi:exodeoxyribonuclease-3